LWTYHIWYVTLGLGMRVSRMPWGEVELEPEVAEVTIFTKRRRRERFEIDRAQRAMERCIAEGHTLKDG